MITGSVIFLIVLGLICAAYWGLARIGYADEHDRQTELDAGTADLGIMSAETMERRANRG